MAQIEQLTLQLKQEEEEFVVKEKKLIQELSMYEVNFILHLRTILDGSVCVCWGVFPAILIS